MKKLGVTIVTAMMLVSLTGCSSLLNEVKDSMVAATAEATITDEELYSELDRMISYPEGTLNEALSGTFTFTAMILSEPEEMTFDDEEETYLYQAACISRNIDDMFLLNISDLEEALPVDEIVSITGTVGGSVYWVDENEKIDVLDIQAEKAEVLPASEIEIDTSNIVNVETTYSNSTFEFVGAHLSKDSFDDAIVLYFNFTNNGTSDVLPSFDKLFFYQGDELLDSSVFSVESVDPAALSAGSAGMTRTIPGKTFYYYYVLKANPEALAEPLYISLYDDAFNLTNDIEIEVASSLEEMEK